MANLIRVGSHTVSYSEVESSSVDRLFNVIIDETEYQLAANSLGEVTESTDHPIVGRHPEVVRAILAREYSALVVEQSDGSQRRLAPGHALVRDVMTKGLAPHLLLGEKIDERAIAGLPIESSDTTSATTGEAVWVHHPGTKCYRRARVVAK